MNYCDFLFNIKDEWKTNTALVDVENGKSFSYYELQNAVISLSEKLRSFNISNKDVILLHMVNSAEVVIAHLAVQYIGGISVLLDPLIPLNSLAYYISDTRSKHLITDIPPKMFNEIDHSLTTILNSSEIMDMICLENGSIVYAPYEFSEDELSVIFYTSGTTNKPKGVMLSPKNYFNHVSIFTEGCYRYSVTDKLLCFVPFSHGYGSKSLFLPCLQAGSGMYIMRSFHPYKVIEAIEKYGITHIFGVPSHYQQLLKKSEFIPTLKKLKASFSAAALLKVETAKKWKEELGIYLDEGYGLIETSTGVAFRINRLPNKLVDVGTYPKNFVKIEIVDDNFNFLKTGEKGEIIIKSKSVMLGYLNKKDETEKAIKNGWFRTGDMGYKNHNEDVILTGRIKDVINIAGIKVAPFEIESEINNHTCVNESAVIGVEDEIYGEVVVAFVQLINGKSLKERELIKYLQNLLMNFQVPKRVIFKENFPRNNMGKIDKKKLKIEFESLN